MKWYRGEAPHLWRHFRLSVLLVVRQRLVKRNNEMLRRVFLSITTVVFLQSLHGPQSAWQVVGTLVACSSAVTEKREELSSNKHHSGQWIPSPPPFSFIWHCEKKKKGRKLVFQQIVTDCSFSLHLEMSGFLLESFSPKFTTVIEPAVESLFGFYRSISVSIRVNKNMGLFKTTVFRGR